LILFLVFELVLGLVLFLVREDVRVLVNDPAFNVVHLEVGVPDVDLRRVRVFEVVVASG
jgi:hypothetical protein